MATVTDQEIQELAQITLIRDRWASDPESFYREALGAEPWEAQVQTCIGVRDYKETSVRSCHGTGKSFNAARVVLWFLSVHPNSIVLSTAPTWRQVKEILWRELRNAHNKAKIPLGGDLHKLSLNIDEDWYAMGLSTDDPDKFQGFHAEHILVVVDEAAGVPEQLFEAIDSVLTSGGARLLMIGNPTSLTGRFYQSHRTAGVKKIHISCFDTPNFKANGIATLDDLRSFDMTQLKIVNPKLIDPRWVLERMERWGVGTPMFSARCLGEFPTQGDDTLIPLNKIEQAMTPERREAIPNGTPAGGNDVARHGDDKTVLLKRYGDNVANGFIRQYSKDDTMVTAGRVKIEANADKDCIWRIDEDGIGGGVLDRLLEEGVPNVQGSRFSSKANDPEQFANKKAELFWIIREKLLNDEMALPDDEELVAQLSNIKWSVNSKGQIVIEKKEDIKKRTLKSPDKADALALSYDQVVEEADFDDIVASGSYDKLGSDPNDDDDDDW